MRFPLGLKLILIVTVILLVSLGLITFLVSVMVSQDLRLTAEDANFSINKRMAATVETILSMTRSASRVVLAAEQNARSGYLVEFFFEQNQDIAALALVSSGREPELLLSNEKFFVSYGIPASLPVSLCAEEEVALKRAAAGDTLLINVSPRAGSPLLAFLFPWREGGREEAVMVLFSASSLAETFGSGMSANTTFLVNTAGDVLVHTDPDLLLAGANIAGDSLLDIARTGGKTFMQTLYEDDGINYFGAFSSVPLGNLLVITRIEESLIYESLIATTRRNLFLTGAVLCLTIILVWFFSKTVSGPIKLLAEAATQIEGGQFEVELQPKTRDEIGVLTASFGKMSKALSIFGRFTNREIAVRAMRGEIKPGGFPRMGTIFFSDIRGFTEKSENFTKMYGDDASDRIVQWLNVYFTRMVDCVEKTGGVVDKFIGDAVMAHWGTAYTAGSPEKDALACVKAALLMRAALLEMNKSRREDDPSNPPIRIGCGINTGPVTAGQIGSERRMEYTVIGDAVNLASRTEALNKPLGTDILITENTWELVGKYIIAEEMPPVSVKGKEKPVRLFAVVGPASATGEQKGLRSMADVRRLLGIPEPDTSKVDVNAEEKKYKIQGG
ncbi:MAG: HAMP domain-containing protein [Spirochaetaceae bacterium]|nr:HAMP domain-containing protein [Spirochaetaceae bacterium]